MGLQIRLRFIHDAPTRHCPRCQSADIWRWARDRSVFRAVAMTLGRHLMTCRGCGHKFYVVKKASEGLLFRLVTVLAGRPLVVTNKARSGKNLEVISGHRDSPQRTRPAQELPALQLSFDEWERKHAQRETGNPAQTPTARLG